MDPKQVTATGANPAVMARPAAASPQLIALAVFLRYLCSLLAVIGLFWLVPVGYGHPSFLPSRLDSVRSPCDGFVHESGCNAMSLNALTGIRCTGVGAA